MIELIVVIVILGLLAATALPKYLDLRNDANMASMQQYAGNLASALEMNYARCYITQTVSSTCVAISDCTDAGPLLQGGLPTSLPGANGSHLYINSQVISASTNGVSAQCTLALDLGVTPTQILSVTFQAIAAGH